MNLGNSKLKAAVVLTGLCLISAAQASSWGDKSDRIQQTLQVLTGHFSPSNARTEDGNFIAVEEFIPAERCLRCHQDTYQTWSQSLHRNAAREPFYRESADILLRTRCIELTRHCESCHTPVALFSGALDKGSKKQDAPFTPLDHEGVTCSVCHSITEARLDGAGSYAIRRPALLAKEDGSPIYGDFTDNQILADVPAHKRAVMRPLLRSPEFCATCHKVDAPPALNNYKHIRGFSAYDEWQQSGASHESLLPFYRREQRTDCRSCHMPKVKSEKDRAAKNGLIASHRWLGANTAAPLFYDQREQAEATLQFLSANVVEVDIFALRNVATGLTLAPLDATGRYAFNPGDEVVAEVVISNRNAAHSFPPEVRDLYEAWVEFEALDAAGKTIFHSGFVKHDGTLDESAHVYKQIILDEQGRQITRHQIWTTNIKAYDNALPPGRSDVARFSFRLPNVNGRKERAAQVTLRARVNYRRFNQEYTNYVLDRQKRRMTLPIALMAEDAAQLFPIESSLTASTALPSTYQAPQWKRWNDYGIGLLEQAQYGAAAEAFRKAAALSPTDSNLLVNAALAEMGTERFGPELDQYLKAEKELAQALMLDPQNVRARFYRAQIWRAQGKISEAADEFRRIAAEYPRDREAQRQLGQTLFAQGVLAEASAAFEALTQIDPTDFAAWQFLGPLYAGMGRRADAERANALYRQWRDDPVTDSIAIAFFAAHPEWAGERIRAHSHGRHFAGRPVLIGKQATPDK